MRCWLVGGVVAGVLSWSLAAHASVLTVFYGRPQRLSPWPCPQGQLFQVHSILAVPGPRVADIWERLTLECRLSSWQARWVVQATDKCQIPEAPGVRVTTDCRRRGRPIQTERGYYLLQRAEFGQQCRHLSLDDLDQGLPGIGEALGQRMIWGTWLCQRITPLRGQRVDLVSQPRMVVKTSVTFQRDPFSPEEIFDYLIYHFSVMLAEADLQRLPLYR